MHHCTWPIRSKFFLYKLCIAIFLFVMQVLIYCRTKTLFIFTMPMKKTEKQDEMKGFVRGKTLKSACSPH